MPKQAFLRNDKRLDVLPSCLIIQIVPDRLGDVLVRDWSIVSIAVFSAQLDPRRSLVLPRKYMRCNSGKRTSFNRVITLIIALSSVPWQSKMQD